jgi:hypothetical protein
MEDVDKLDNIQDCFNSSSTTSSSASARPLAFNQFLNGQVQLANQKVLQQQHVDHKIANALLKKGTREAYKKWNALGSTCACTNRTTTREASASPTKLSQGTPRRTRQTLGLSPSWALSFALTRKFGCQATTSRIPPPGSSPPFVRSSTCTQHFCRTTTTQNILQWTCPHCRQAPPVRSQDTGSVTLVLPQLNRLHETYKRI